MKEHRQTEDISTNAYIVRRPLYWSVFLLIMFVVSLVALLLDTSSTEINELSDIIIVGFYLIFGFSIFIPATVIFFVLLAVNLYIYFRFKLVIHEQSFSVTPLFEATHDIAFSSVEKVVIKRWSRMGHYVEIEYDSKKIRIPYTVNLKDGTFRQKSIYVLLKKLENYTTINISGKLSELFKS